MAINLQLNKLPWYGQVGLFVVLAIAGAGVFWNYYVVPKKATFETRRSELATLEGEIRRGLATAQRGDAFKKEITDLERQLTLLSTVLPEEQDVADLLNRVQEMANESRLSIRGFSPQTIARRTLHAEYPYTLQLEGTYHDLGNFLSRVSRFARIINVSGMKIRARDEQRPGGPTISVDCTATTFVLLETPAAPAPGAPAPTGA